MLHRIVLASLAVFAVAAAFLLHGLVRPGVALAAAGEDSVGDPEDGRLSSDETIAGRQAADLAVSLIGTPYRWGGVSPQTGFDCSGLVTYVYRQFGVALGRDSFSQFRNGAPVARGDLEPGDIVFFANTYAPGISHAGVYIGDGQFVHALYEGVSVKINGLADAYWGPRYAGARRVL